MSRAKAGDTLSVPPPIFGDGWEHVIADPTWRQIKPDPFVGARLELAPLWTVMNAAAERLKEKATLFKDALGEEVRDENVDAYFNVTKSFMKLEHEIRDLFQQHGLSKQKRRAWLARQVVLQMMDIIREVVQRTKADPQLLGNGAIDDEVIQLVTALPSQRVYLEAMAISFDNLQFPRARGDMDDLGSLSCATVYCDVVVAEKTWGSMIKRTTLAQEYGTTVLYDLQELIPLLDEWART